MHRFLLIAAVAGCVRAVAPHPSIELSDRQVAFAGRSWSMRASDVPTGAGPIRWSDAPEAVSVEEGRLCLTLHEADGGGMGAEVLTPWRRRRAVEVELDPLDGALRDASKVVVGVFLYRNDGDELDAEWSSWGETAAGAPGFQFVVPPATPHRRLQVAGELPDRVRLQWRRQGARFRAGRGGSELRWRSSERLAGRGPWFLHINVWTLHGVAPARPVRVCVRSVQ